MPVRAADRRLVEDFTASLMGIEVAVRTLKANLAAAGLDYETTDFDRFWEKIGGQLLIPNRPIIVAFAGVANAGKSTGLNSTLRAEGEQRLTRAGPIGGLTTIPTVFLSEGSDPRYLSALFPGYELRPLRNQDEATAETHGKRILLWKKHPLVPPNVVVVDVPDFDSVKRNNERLALPIIMASDLVMVMLDESYANHDNVALLQDIAASDKPSIAVFNRSHIDFHRKHWPQRLEHLRKVAGIQFLGGFAIKNDPERAENGQVLDFFRIGKDGLETPVQIDPLTEIENLEVDRVRMQAQLGAVEQALAAPTGLANFLKVVEETNASLTNLRRMLGEKESAPAKGQDWPEMPSGALSQTVLATWQSQHQSWTTKAVLAVPLFLQKGGASVVRFLVRDAIAEKERAYRDSEWDYLQKEVVARLLGELKQLRDSGHVSGRLAKILRDVTDGEAYFKAQVELQRQHAKLKLVGPELQRAIEAELNRLKKEEPDTYQSFHNRDLVLAAAQLVGPPVVGFLTGGVVSIPLTWNFFTSFATGAAQGIVGGLTFLKAAPAIAVKAERSREKMLTDSLETIQNQYAMARVVWVMQWMKDHYLKEFYEALSEAFQATSTPEVRRLREHVDCARRIADQLRRPRVADLLN